MTRSTLPPDVADLLRAAVEGLERCDRPGFARGYVAGALLNVLEGHHDTEQAACLIRRRCLHSNVCDTCHSEPVTVIDGNRRQCATCALKVCDCCQVRRATVIWGVTELCPLCAEERAAEAERNYGAEVAVAP